MALLRSVTRVSSNCYPTDIQYMIVFWTSTCLSDARYHFGIMDMIRVLSLREQPQVFL